MHISQKGFTLVELIVVLTLISILSTIGFITLIRSNSDARDAIRLSNTKVLTRTLWVMINTERIGDIQSYVNPLLPQNTFSSGSVFGESISGDVQYVVGAPNSIQFGNNDYRDELTGNAYPMAIIRGNFGTYFQVAAKLEDNTALVQGNYYALSTNDLPGIIKAFDSNTSVTDGGQSFPY